MATLSPLMMMAAKGLLDNTALGINEDLSAKITTYESLSTVSAFASVLSTGGVSGTTLSNLQTFTASIFPAVNNTIPSSNTELTATDRFTTALKEHANNILGNGDLSKYATHMNIISAFAMSNNEFINAAEQSGSYLGPTFNDMDSLSTGNISSVSSATEELGTDLANTGTLIDLSRLDIYGTPQALLLRLHSKGLLPYISEELDKAGIDVKSLITLLNTFNESEILDIKVQKVCYDAYKTVTGEKLANIMAVFGVEVNNVNTLADLIDTHILFATSRYTLKAPSKNGFKLIFLNNSATTNGIFSGIGKTYHSVMPSGITDANVAFKRSLQQIKNIQDLQTPVLANMVKEIQTNVGLNDINELTSPIDADTLSYFTNTFASGSGENGKYYVSDGVGTPAGIVHNDQMSTVNEKLAALIASGELDTLLDAFAVMQDLLDGNYDAVIVNPGDPAVVISGASVGNGSYDNYNEAMDAIITDTTTVLNSIVSANSSEVTVINEATTAMSSQIDLELNTLTAAEVDMSTTPSSRSSIMSLAGNLHNYARQDEYRGPAELLEKMAQTTTLGGQAVIGALREGRNLAKMSAAGVGSDNIPDIPQPIEKAEVSSGKYSLTDAQSLAKIS
jgi:hypothetical protein